MAPKRSRASSTSTRGDASAIGNKRVRSHDSGHVFNPRKIATREAAATVDSNPPLQVLLRAVESAIEKPERGESVVYWMRLNDLRISDNRALSMASERAKKDEVPLIVLFVITPQDYIAHDRGARKIDFVLRNLKSLRARLADLNIPLHVTSHTPRTSLPSYILTVLESWGCTSLFANIEYEVDELRRDIKICELAKKRCVKPTFVHDKCIVDASVVLKKDDSYYAVFSPYLKLWTQKLNSSLECFLKDYPEPLPNTDGVRDSKKFAPLFEIAVPDFVTGFELIKEDAETMRTLWPAGENAAHKVLDNFLSKAASMKHIPIVDPYSLDSSDSEDDARILLYKGERDLADKDTTSRLSDNDIAFSPYLSAGIISARTCVRSTMKLLGIAHVDASRDTGVGRWVQELAWRDFYTNVLVGFSRVSMGRPFVEKYADVVWEDAIPEYKKEENSKESEAVRRWKEGKTGIPIVDAGMRCLNKQGWMHNRLRMIVAMYLVKDLMVDWHIGEKYFMENLIDGDFASNNGGWQWSASTGVDPAPYFRIFNPYLQGPKADPSGNFIRQYVPELSNLRTPEIYHPSRETAQKLDYPLPMIDHKEARDRAIRRFKTPGEQ
ncbi:hypothetical protein FISHEDRAFT_65353 [Fistulina hepatica ATCC 64428]|nr:hypothetical protein FISHEDRAFT_65353 [Fistulina hepatica ATCC 64428]